jgi:hypothetical protein
MAIRSECSELVCFRLAEDGCLEWSLSRGMNADEIKALPDLPFVAPNVDRGMLRGKIRL